MAETGFERALPRVLVHEGGKVDDSRDPGGRTNQGVTQRVYDAYRRKKGYQKRDVYSMTDAERDEIYRSQYWNAVQGDQLHEGVGYVVFDGAVNSGPKQSIKWLQRALGVAADGVLGMATLGALKGVTDNDALIGRIIERREAFLRSLKTFKTFGNGWMRRINNVEQTGQAWATGSIGPAVNFIPEANRKAIIVDAVEPPSKIGGDMATGGGAVGGGVTVTVQQLQDQLTPFSMAGGWISKLVIALAIISALLAIGGIAWRVYAVWKKKKIEDATDPDGAAPPKPLPEGV